MLRGNRLLRSNRRPINSKLRARKIGSWLLSYLRRIMPLSSMSTIKRMPNLRKFSRIPRRAWQSPQ
jgi:hypothetical protein